MCIKNTEDIKCVLITLYTYYKAISLKLWEIPDILNSTADDKNQIIIQCYILYYMGFFKGEDISE